MQAIGRSPAQNNLFMLNLRNYHSGKLIYVCLLIYSSGVARLLGAPAGSELDYAALTLHPVERQLFLDDFILGDLYRVARIIHQPRKYGTDPILRPDLPTDGNIIQTRNAPLSLRGAGQSIGQGGGALGFRHRPHPARRRWRRGWRTLPVTLSQRHGKTRQATHRLVS